MGRADVIPKLKLALPSQRGESLASHSPCRDLLTPSGANRRKRSPPRPPRRGNPVETPQSSPSGTRLRDFLGARTQEPEPRFLWAKAALSVVVVVFIQPQPPQKMNRSFHKSQPLRNVDCNAVEVKSKVGLKWRGLWVCWRFLGGGVVVGGGGRVHMVLPSRSGAGGGRIKNCLQPNAQLSPVRETKRKNSQIPKIRTRTRHFVHISPLLHGLDFLLPPLPTMQICPFFFPPSLTRS